MENNAEYKIAPHSISSEQCILGGLLIDKNAWDKIADRVGEQDFYRRDHQIIFTAIKALAEEDKPCDIITISEWLESRNRLEAVGGLAYLGGLAKNTPSSANIVTYADIVRERSVLRQIIAVSTDTANLCFETNGMETREILAEAESKIFSIRTQNTGDNGLKPICSSIDELVNNLDALIDNQGFMGIASGFDGLDEMLNGLHPSDLIILAGRPSMGKTSMAMNIAEHAALELQKKVAIFSLEQPASQLTQRLITSISGFKFGKGFDSDRIPVMANAATRIKNAPIFIDDTGGLTPYELKARAKRMACQHGVDLIVVDYLQLMNAKSKTSGTRNDEVSEISRQLKALAKELNVPVIALSQLNRGLEQRPNKRPVMADLRDSGAIEQDADVILFVYRDEVYNRDSNDKGTAEIIIAKHRNGATGTVRMVFNGERFRFDDFSTDTGHSACFK